MKHGVSFPLLCLLPMLAGPQAWAADIEISGFIKTNVIFSRYHDGSLAEDSPARDFYYPAAIPIGGDDNSTFDFSLKDSRFSFRGEETLDGFTARTSLSLDFLVPMQGNEAVNNSYNPRVREAVVEFLSATGPSFVVGQTWSGFHNANAWPETINSTGPAESIAFARQPIIGVIQDGWQIALENPESWTASDSGSTISGKSSHPDITLNFRRDGYFLAILAREVIADNGERTTGFGLTFSGNHELPTSDDIRWMLTAGRGIGRYVGHGFTQDAVETPNGLEPVETVGGFLAYRHFWTPAIRSTIVASYIETEVAATSPMLNIRGSSVHLNLLWNPTAVVELGIEWLHGKRQQQDGAEAAQSRMIVSARYYF